MEYKIGVFDSGKGGLSILQELQKILPTEDYLYYGDQIHHPYGSKTKKELLEITRWIVKNLKERGCKVIVIACNTATTHCMEELKKEFPDLIFVGTVPAIKMACDNHYKNTLVLVTPTTAKSKRMKELIRDNQQEDQKITVVPCKQLAEYVEAEKFEEIPQKLKELLEQYQQEKIDSIVLGCTHYSWIKEEIQKMFPKAVLLDGSIGVAKEVKRQLEKNNLINKKKEGSSVILENF